MKNIFATLFSVISFISLGQTTTLTLTASGSFSLPCGVTTITVQCWGGGGGGGGGAASGNKNGGGGGGGGAYTINTSVAVTPLTLYNYIVGATAAGGSAGNAGTPGKASIVVVGATTVTANGGGAGGGYVTTGGTAGAGGTGTFNGGNGAAGLQSTYSGGGGEGASSIANGASTTNQTGATGTSGGNGGNGTTGSSANGSPGSSIGGGGGGGTKTSTGGAGAQGEIQITYTTPPTSANAGPNQLLCNTGTFALSATAAPSGFTGAWSCITNCTGISFSNASSATSSVSTVPANTAVTIRWTLTHTASGCTLKNNAVVTNSTSCPPLNDNCANATPFPAVPTTGACASLSNQTTGSASNSNVTPTGACTSNSGTPDDDVWFSFIATSTTQILSATWVSGNTDVYWQVFSSSCGSTMTSVLCTDIDAGATMTGLTIGNTYYVRLYTYWSGDVTTQNICISSPPPPPTNDNPCSAIPVTVNSAFSCTTETGGTVAGATASGNTLGSCYGTADDDVWFSFIANNTNQYINLNNLSGSTTDMYFSVYSGACSALGTALICSDPETGIVSGLTVGNTYIIRIYSYTSTIGQNSTFSICITPPPIQPANDNPCSATLASVNSAAGTCTTQTAGTIAGATASGNTLGACFGTADDDVWYSFIANSTSMNINLNNVTGSTTDLYHSVFAGVCGTLGAALICSDPNSSTINSLTIGATYFIRIYSYTNSTGQTTTFSLCINPTPPPPLNVTCNQMQPICSGSPIVFQAQSTGGSAAVGPNYGCLYSTPNPTWFFIEILTSGTMDIDLNAASDVDFALWGPYANLSAAQADCGTYPNPLDCSYSSSNVEQMNIASVVTGQVYAVLVTNYANVIQSITLNQANGASATTNCAILLPIDLLYFDVTLNQDVVNINWATESEINIHHFEIEKSIKGDKWETISYINGMGNSQVKTNYKSIDKQPYQNLSYYRLKQINIDETYNYSNIAAIDISKGKDQITDIHPNPTSDKIEFEILSKNKNTIIVEVINNIGTIISSQQNNIDEGNNLINLNLEKFDSGMYLIKISFENSEKILLQKIIKH